MTATVQSQLCEALHNYVKG